MFYRAAILKSVAVAPAFVFLALTLSACQAVDTAQAPPDLEFLNTPEATALKLPFSEAVRVNNILYLSGQIGVLPGTTTLVSGGIQSETRQTMENIRTTLQRYGSNLGRVFKCTIFLADIAEWPQMNEVYRTYFPGSPPARSAFAATGLAFNARVEIDCQAVIASG